MIEFIAGASYFNVASGITTTINNNNNATTSITQLSLEGDVLTFLAYVLVLI